MILKSGSRFSETIMLDQKAIWQRAAEANSAVKLK